MKGIKGWENVVALTLIGLIGTIIWILYTFI